MLTLDEEEQRYFRFLDQLQMEGSINMYGATGPLMEMFGLSRKEAREVLTKWMNTWSERHEK